MVGIDNEQFTKRGESRFPVSIYEQAAVEVQFDDMTIADAKRVWRVANVLASKAEFEPVDASSGPWLYASTESPEHKARFEAWLQAHGGAGDILVYAVRGSHEVIRLPWSDVVNHTENYFGGSDIRILGDGFDWIIDYKKEQIIRYGRLKSSNQRLEETPGERSAFNR